METGRKCFKLLNLKPAEHLYWQTLSVSTCLSALLFHCTHLIKRIPTHCVSVMLLIYFLRKPDNKIT